MNPYRRTMMIVLATNLLVVAAFDPSATSRRVETRAEKTAFIERTETDWRR